MPPKLAPGIQAAVNAIRGAASASPQPVPRPPSPRAASPAASSRLASTMNDPATASSSSSGSRMTPMKRPLSPGVEEEVASKTEEQQEGEAASIPSTPPAKRKRAPRKPKEPIVYVIPDVEKKTTTFKGRLGYACLNTVLRKQKPSVFCSRTCRIDTIQKKGMDFLKDLARQNVEDLHKMILWNAEHHIYFMRVSSELLPFAAHAEYGYDIACVEKELKKAGDAANELGMRLTTHPGQYTQLGSPTKKVVDNAIADLEYHARMLTLMGMGKDSVMIIHGGGTYNDKPAAIARFKSNYQRLSEDVRGRLVLENDEICYNVDDLLPLCNELNIPLVFDYHHDQLFPSERDAAALMPDILKTWEKKGIKVKQHLSEPRKGAVSLMERRAHSDRCQNLPDALPVDVDLMLEAKDKEQAVFHMYRMYDLAPVIHDSLRPPALEETKQTAGRKSRTPKKKVKTEDGEEEVDELDELVAAEEEGAERIEDEGETLVGGSPVAEAKPAPQNKKRLTKKQKEEAAAAAALEQEAVKMEDGAPSAEDPLAAKSPLPQVKPAKKKRLTKKEKEALAASAAPTAEAQLVKEEEQVEVKPEVDEERPAPPRRRSTRGSVA